MTRTYSLDKLKRATRANVLRLLVFILIRLSDRHCRTAVRRYSTDSHWNSGVAIISLVRRLVPVDVYTGRSRQNAFDSFEHSAPHISSELAYSCNRYPVCSYGVRTAVVTRFLFSFDTSVIQSAY
jgi:hypothetical protein